MSLVHATARRRSSLANSALTTAAILVFVFLYIPLAIVVLYSFSGETVNVWPIGSYTTRWYGEMWNDPQIRRGIELSVKIGLISAGLAILLGTLAALAIDRFNFRGKGTLRFFVVLPITLPGIVTGIAMLSFFSLSGTDLSNRTIIIGHTTFCITLILNNVIARMSQIPRSLDEAAADLGATPWRTFWTVTFPLILPAILSGGILAFTLSFDEIVVTLFLKGRDATLPLVIWARLRRGFSPEINAAATMIIGVSFVAIVIANRLARRTGT
jgi:ABC-type spermidine/putrescine transport system permease subunit II